MKTTKTSFCIALFAIGLIGMAITGCSVIGLTLGAISDAQNEALDAVPVWDIQSIKPGSFITLVLKNGNTVQGVFTGLEPMPDGHYVELCNRVRSANSDNLFLPASGDTVTVSLQPENSRFLGRKFNGRFRGFDAGAVLLAGKKNPADYRIEMKRIDRIQDKRGRSATGYELKAYTMNGRLPILSGIAVTDSSGQKVLAVDQIAHIHIPVRKHGAVTGLITGAVIDVIAFTVCSAMAWSDWNRSIK